MMLPFIRKPLKNYWGCQKGLTGTLKSSACCPLFHPYSWPFLWRWVSCTNKITFDCNSWTSESREKQLADYREWGCPRQTRQKEQEKQVLIKATSRLSIFPFVPWSLNTRLKSVIPVTRYTRRSGDWKQGGNVWTAGSCKVLNIPRPKSLQHTAPAGISLLTPLLTRVILVPPRKSPEFDFVLLTGGGGATGGSFVPALGISCIPVSQKSGILNQNLTAQVFASNVLSLIDVIWEKNLGLFLASGCCCFLCIYTKETAITRIILHHVHA